MSYQVQLAVFAGPLDLLLHLIERSELDIYDIPIATITEQFLAYLRTMELLNLEIAGEFLVMAATLMQIKARMLLPKPVTLEAEPGEEDEDPRRELVDRLLEYRRFKEAAILLRRREEEQATLFPRQGGVFADQVIISTAAADPGGLDIWRLIEAFQAVLAETSPAEDRVPVPAEQITVRQVMTEILGSLRQGGGSLEFVQIFAGRKTRHGLITAFVALLELIRLGRVMAYQEAAFGRIVVCLRPTEVVPA